MCMGVAFGATPHTNGFLSLQGHKSLLQVSKFQFLGVSLTSSHYRDCMVHAFPSDGVLVVGAVFW